MWWDCLNNIFFSFKNSRLHSEPNYFLYIVNSCWSAEHSDSKEMICKMLTNFNLNSSNDFAGCGERFPINYMIASFSKC